MGITRYVVGLLGGNYAEGRKVFRVLTVKIMIFVTKNLNISLKISRNLYFVRYNIHSVNDFRNTIISKMLKITRNIVHFVNPIEIKEA